MLYSVRGTLIHKSHREAVVECGGVGYRCLTTLTTANQLPALGREVKLYTYLSVRENGLELFGFASPAEHNCFVLLTSVTGVGPKVGLAILSELSPDQIMLGIVSNDVKSLTRAAGVGPKLAQRIILELKDKVKSDDLSQGLAGVGQVTRQAVDGSSVGEALAALVVLGYSQSEAAQAIAGMPPESTVEELIKGALKQLSGRR